MKMYACILAAACLVAGGSMTTTWGDNPVLPVDKNAKLELTPEFPGGIAVKDLNASTSIQSSLAKVGEQGLGKDAFDDIVGYLVDQDRVRINDKKKDQKFDDVKALTDKISANLKTKYGKDFKVENSSLQNTIKILTGEIENTDALLNKWPVDAAPRPITEIGQGKVAPGDVQEAKKMFGGDVNLEKGRKVALVTIPKSHGRRAVTASMISEATAWRFDIPNNIDADALHKQLVNGLNTLANQTTWPDEFADAQRMVTHVIVGSIYGVDMTPSNELLKTAGDK